MWQNLLGHFAMRFFGLIWFGYFFLLFSCSFSFIFSLSGVPCLPLDPSLIAPPNSFSAATSPSSPASYSNIGSFVARISVISKGKTTVSNIPTTVALSHTNGAWGGQYQTTDPNQLNKTMELILPYPDAYSCTPIQLPPWTNKTLQGYYGGKYALVLQGICTHAFKGMNLMYAGTGNATGQPTGIAGMMQWWHDSPHHKTNNSYYPPNGYVPGMIPMHYPDSAKSANTLFAALNAGYRLSITITATYATCDGDWQALINLMQSMRVSIPPSRLYIRSWMDLADPVLQLKDPCIDRIQGITCVGNRVVSVLVSGISLALVPGALSMSKALGDLTALVTLDLSSNFLSGIFPSLSALSSLQSMIISSNVPGFSSLSQVDYSVNTNLIQFVASANQLTNMPIALPKSITIMAIGSNPLSGPLPPYSALPNLLSFDISVTSLSGSLSMFSNTSLLLNSLFVFSTQISQLPDPLSPVISMVLAASSSITGIPSSYSAAGTALTQLTVLDVSKSKVTTVSNVQFTAFTAINSINFADNYIADTTTPVFKGLAKLTTIDFHDNKLAGSIPSNMFDNCNSLATVAFSNNNLTGNLPNFVGQTIFGGSQSLVSVDFSYNKLSGFIPLSWTYSPIQSLFLQHNCLSASSWPNDQTGGANAHKFADISLPQLSVLDISYNCNISAAASQYGDVAVWLQSMPTTMTSFNAAGNLISLPFTTPDSSTSNYANWTTLNLANNRISKFNYQTITSAISFPKLQLLDLSNNAIVGDAIPHVDPVPLASLFLSGNPGITLPLVSNSSSSLLPSYLSYSSSYTKSNLAQPYACQTLQNPLRQMTLTLDASSLNYATCVCDAGYYNSAPNCISIPFVVPSHASMTLTDAIYGSNRLMQGMDTVWLLNGSPDTRYIQIALTFNTTSFNQISDLLSIYTGDESLQGLQVTSFSGTEVALVPPPPYVTVFASQAAVNFRTRQVSGSHFSLTWQSFTSCPVGYITYSNTCVLIIEPNTAYQSLVYALTAIALCVNLIVFAVLTYMRNSVIVRSSSYLFSSVCLLAISGIAVSAVLFAKTAEEGSAICHARAWLLPLSVVAVLSTIVARTNRINLIFNNSKLSTSIRIRDSDVGIVLSSFVLLELVACILFTALSLTSQTVQIQSAVANTAVYLCASTEQTGYLTWLVVQCIFLFTILVLALYLAFQIKDVPAAFNEAVAIFQATLGFAAFAVLLIPIQFIVDSDQNALILLRGVGCTLCALIFTFALFAPRLLYIVSGRANDKTLQSAATHKGTKPLSGVSNVSGGVGGSNGSRGSGDEKNSDKEGNSVRLNDRQSVIERKHRPTSSAISLQPSHSHRASSSAVPSVLIDTSSSSLSPPTSPTSSLRLDQEIDSMSNQLKKLQEKIKKSGLSPTECSAEFDNMLALLSSVSSSASAPANRKTVVIHASSSNELNDQD